VPTDEIVAAGNSEQLGWPGSKGSDEAGFTRVPHPPLADGLGILSACYSARPQSCEQIDFFAKAREATKEVPKQRHSI
jgi:hypothetical protein